VIIALDLYEILIRQGTHAIHLVNIEFPDNARILEHDLFGDSFTQSDGARAQ